MSKIGIIGLGLMGASLGLALKKYLPENEIYGDDLNDENFKYAVDNDIIDKNLSKDIIKEMKIIFIAVPINNTIDVLNDIYSNINSETLVTDLGSTKSFLISEINKNFPDMNYIGGHPMAGKETSGPQSAEADLFKNKSYILVNDNDNLNEEADNLKNIIQRIGANVYFLKGEEHDKLVAKTSHLPQIIASSLIYEFIKSEEENSEIAKLIGTGFLDTTRIAASNPEIWEDIFLTNKDNVLKGINSFIETLKDFRDNLKNENQKLISDFLLQTKNKRLDIEKEKEYNNEIND